MATPNVETNFIDPFILANIQNLMSAGAINLREGDRQECEAMGLLPFQVIAECVNRSVESFVVTIDGEVAATWGYSVNSVIGNICYPWLFTTPVVEKHKMIFARGSLSIVNFLLARFPEVRVLVDCRYADSIGWLEWLGFDCWPTAVRVGPKAMPFLIMSHRDEDKEAKVWAQH